MSMYESRGELLRAWKGKVKGKAGGNERERDVRLSVGSDMSIDDPTEEQAGAHLGPNHPQPTWQQNKPIPSFAIASRRSSSSGGSVYEKNEEADSEKKKKKEEDQPGAQPARRLSVQDRINLFESKQKEISSSTSSSSAGGSSGGAKPIVGKPGELRRLSSDVSGAEKSVLRRWSGASDMSIDTESPSSSSVLATKSNAEHRNSNPEVSSNAPAPRTLPSASAKEDDSKDKSAGRPQPQLVINNDEGSSQDTSKVSPFPFHHDRALAASNSKETQFRGSIPSGTNQAASQVPSALVTATATDTADDVTSDIKSSATRDDDDGGGGMKNRPVAQSFIRASHAHSRSLSAQFESKFRDVEGDQSTPQPQLRSFTAEPDEVIKKDSSFSTKHQTKVEDSEFPKMKYQKPQPGSAEQVGRPRSKRVEIRVPYETGKLNLPVKQVLQSQDSAQVTSIPPLEQVQRVRQSKGNQGLHDELKMKADELEKLFAEHKLRVPGDQSGSVRRTEPLDAHVEQAVNSEHRRPRAAELTPQLSSRNAVLEPTSSSSNVPSFDAMSVSLVNNHNYGDALRQSFSDINFGDDSRGKFYEKYMKKREAKLREEWSSKKAEKEARMKAMQDSLERSRAEMKAKFSGSIDRQHSASGAYRAEKLRSFKSNIKREQVYFTCFMIFVITANL